MRKALVAGAVVLVAALGGAFATAMPASAGNNDGQGDPGEVVLTQDWHFGPPYFDEQWNLYNYQTRNFIGTSTNLNDNASSVINYDPGWSIVLSEHSNCSGGSITLTPQGGPLWYIADLGTWGFADRLSSHCWFT
jgi:hypothetical protein